uniref:GTPase n=1 Tax=candidate division WOR-3 bacterium TaxID=2052148 RepID=A0A7C3YT09_UNCW3
MRKVLILGAGGRDFHNFNTFFRENSLYRVVGFTFSSQIPGVKIRLYPPELAGELYPDGIPIYPEKRLKEIIKKEGVDICVFSYSDVSFESVMEKAEIAHSLGCDFWLLGPKSTMLKAKKPVLAVCAVRTGAGKSPTTRKVCSILRELGIKFCVVRHPMVYGNFQYPVQVFKTVEDLNRYDLTFEEREEYEHHLKEGNPVLAGVSYERLLEEAEKYDLIIWDGGNNDFPFFKPDFLIVLLDALRPGHEVRYHPGMSLFLAADLIIVNKVDEAKREDLKAIERNIKRYNPRAKVCYAQLAKRIIGEMPKGKKKVVVVEDGPSVTHGELGYGAGYRVAKRFGLNILDPRRFAVGTIKEAFSNYPHLKEVIPALGYKKKQVSDLKKTILRSGCDFVLSATPITLANLLAIKKPIVQIEYSLKETKGDLRKALRPFLEKLTS